MASSVASSHRTILVAVDESIHSTHALKWALDNIIRAESDNVIILTVLLPISVYSGGAGPAYVIPSQTLIALHNEHKRNAKKIAQKAQELCDEKKVKCEIKNITGEPREVICEHATSVHANMLIMGSRGLGAIKRAFLGSVSDYCIHHAKCPVIIVKPESS